ncbi:MAG: 16S rRNA (uracil(1498)-N(3))-methyltransferase, partial [Pirellulales bacterium]
GSVSFSKSVSSSANLHRFVRAAVKLCAFYPACMSRRFFSEQAIVGPAVTLRGPEAHHLAHVLRAKPGDEVELFDGLGAEFSARIERVGRTEVQLAIVESRPVERELDFELTLAVALPKGDRQRWLVEKATELGVARLVPLVTQRSVAQPAAGAIERLRRTVIEASKQCGRNRLMEVNDLLAWHDWLASAPADACRLVGHPGGLGAITASAAGARQVFASIGPEGGFTEEESAAAERAGWTLVDLGPRILRVETAATLLTAMVLSARESVPRRTQPGQA